MRRGNKALGYPAAIASALISTQTLPSINIRVNASNDACKYIGLFKEKLLNRRVDICLVSRDVDVVINEQRMVGYVNGRGHLPPVAWD